MKEYTRSSDLRGILSESDVREFEDIDQILQNVSDPNGIAGFGNIKLTIRKTELLRKATKTLEQRRLDYYKEYCVVIGKSNVIC